MSAATKGRRRSADRLLEGPAPSGVIQWSVSLTTDKRLHVGPASKWFEYRGVRLHYSGRVSWSTIHHEYSVHLGRGRYGGRELERALTASPESALKDLARRLDVLPSDLCARTWTIKQPRCPDGLCGRCWDQGVRSVGRTYSLHREPDGWNLVPRDWLADLCDEHAAKFNAVLL